MTDPIADKAAPRAETECVLIIHEVDDYQKWKAIFNAAAGIRREAGEIEYQLLCLQSNERQIVHFSRWRSLDAARLFFESDRLVQIRKRAGVHTPDFLYLRQIEQAVL